MNHVTNHSPGYKVFKRCFVTLMTIATMISTFHCGNSIAKEPGEEIEQHDIKVQSSKFTAGVSDILEAQTFSGKQTYALSKLVIKEVDVLMQEEQIETEHEEEKNIFYYVNDGQYKGYLDRSYQEHLYNMCMKYDVKEYYTLFLAQMYHESTFQTNAISVTNDYGLMQINKMNHEWLSEKLGINDFLNPYSNIEAGIYIMSNFLHKYNDVEKALVCYNGGEGAVINGTHSTSYSKGVLDDMNLLVKLD